VDGDLRKHNRTAAASSQSLSCRAVLFLIMNKAIDRMKDSERIGLMIQLINEVWEAFTCQYRW
jgi:hypothetical protein